MNKNINDTLRREVEVLLKTLNDSGVDIYTTAAHLDRSPSALYSWANGGRNISKKKLLELRDFVRNRNLIKKKPQFAIEENKQQAQDVPINKFSDELVKALLSLPGRMDQLTKQISDLQGNDAIILDRLQKLESEKQPEPFYGINDLADEMANFKNEMMSAVNELKKNIEQEEVRLAALEKKPKTGKQNTGTS